VIALDTGICAVESPATLALQQRQMVDGRRDVQMFPLGTPELDLPEGMARCTTTRGIFHYRPAAISKQRICTLSTLGRENEFLLLGPYSKYDVAVHAKRYGQPVVFITEYVGETELRSACATLGTLPELEAYFEATKEPGGRIAVGDPPARVTEGWKGQ
jgi:hypothetical protein